MLKVSTPIMSKTENYLLSSLAAKFHWVLPNFIEVQNIVMRIKVDAYVFNQLFYNWHLLHSQLESKNMLFLWRNMTLNLFFATPCSYIVIRI